jgi:hypothetical protein
MHANSPTVTRSVKLFPRLATSNRTRRGPILSTRGVTRDSLGAEVRTRLLNMILVNEDARRNDRRPNAG